MHPKYWQATLGSVSFPALVLIKYYVSCP